MAESIAEQTMDTLLAARDARLREIVCDWETVATRLALTKRLAVSYPIFEHVRDGVLGPERWSPDADQRQLLAALEEYGLAHWNGTRWIAAGPLERRYLSGGWLEEYLGAAVKAAGADEAHYGQKIAWNAGGFAGENEVDVLARFGKTLLFVSCKALRADLRKDDRGLRQKLMDALHQTDNLMDHFSDGRARAALAVTTDLYDEARRGPRYEQLHGKAAALGVVMIGQETLPWQRLVDVLGRLMTG